MLGPSFTGGKEKKVGGKKKLGKTWLFLKFFEAKFSAQLGGGISEESPGVLSL